MTACNEKRKEQVCGLMETGTYSDTASVSSPGYQIDGPSSCARGEELEGEPVVPRLHPPPHLVPQPVSAVCVQHRGRTSGAFLGALAAVTCPAGVALTRLPAGVHPLVHHAVCGHSNRAVDTV